MAEGPEIEVVCVCVCVCVCVHMRTCTYIGLQVFHVCWGKYDKTGNPIWNSCIPPLTAAEVSPWAGAAGRNLLPLGFNKGLSLAPSHCGGTDWHLGHGSVAMEMTAESQIRRYYVLSAGPDESWKLERERGRGRQSWRERRNKNTLYQQQAGRGTQTK